MCWRIPWPPSCFPQSSQHSGLPLFIYLQLLKDHLGCHGERRMHCSFLQLTRSTCANTHASTDKHAYTRAHILMYAHPHAYIRISIYVHTHIHIRISTHTLYTLSTITYTHNTLRTLHTFMETNVIGVREKTHFLFNQLYFEMFIVLRDIVMVDFSAPLFTFLGTKACIIMEKCS